MTTETRPAKQPPYDGPSPARLAACSRGGYATAQRLTPEERSAKASRAAKALHARVSREQLQEWGRRGAATTTALLSMRQKRERGLKGASSRTAALPPERRAEIARIANAARKAKLTPEQLREAARRGGVAVQRKRRARLAEWRLAWLVATPWPHTPGTPCAKAPACEGEAFAHSLCMVCCLVALAPATHAIGSVA